MIDVTDRASTLRRATAEATVRMARATAAAIREGRVPKGDVAEMTRATALLGLKRTPELLPYCHRIPIEHATVRLEVGDDSVRVEVEVAAIARTGVEVEAMTGAAVAALNVYDMLKPIDPGAVIGDLRVVAKSGGRSQFVEAFATPPRAGVLVVSDSVAAGAKPDRAGAAVRTALAAHGLAVVAFEIVPDEPEEIAATVRRWVDDERIALACAVGGTGLGPRDRTPEAIQPLLEREIPGIAEHLRSFGMERTPYAALSRAVAGQRGGAVLLALPGSTSGAREAMDALLPWLLHVLKVLDRTYRHGR